MKEAIVSFQKLFALTRLDCTKIAITANRVSLTSVAPCATLSLSRSTSKFGLTDWLLCCATGVAHWNVMFSDLLMEVQYDKELTDRDFVEKLETHLTRMDEQVNYIAQVDDKNRKVFFHLDAARKREWEGDVAGLRIVGLDMRKQSRNIVCQCGGAVMSEQQRELATAYCLYLSIVQRYFRRYGSKHVLTRKAAKNMREGLGADFDTAAQLYWSMYDA